MAYDANTFVELRIEYIVNDQLCMNVLHYRPGVPGVGPVRDLVASFLAAVVGQGAGGLLDSMAQLMSQETAISRVVAQPVFPVRYRINELDVNIPGVKASTISRQNTGLTLTKRGDLGNRTNIGSFHLGGMGDASFAFGEIAPGEFARVGTLANNLKFTITDAVEGIDYYPVIANKEKIPDTDPPKYRFKGSTVITDVDVPDISARVMRRRTLRLGI